MAGEAATRGAGRPPASDRQSVEQIALDLMLRDGYESVSVNDIAAAAAISRTTFFRYFGSKPGVVWAAFEVTISDLRDALADEQGASGVLDAVRHAIGVSTGRAIYDSDAWLERFWLLDGNETLRAGALERWDRWRQTVADFVAAQIGSHADAALPLAIAAAAQATFLAELRSGPREGRDRATFLKSLDADLHQILSAFEGLVASRKKSAKR